LPRLDPASQKRAPSNQLESVRKSGNNVPLLKWRSTAIPQFLLDQVCLFISKYRNIIMFTQLTSTMLLLASVAVAQTPSVVTFISISPTPLSEGVLSIQTVAPVFSESACYEVCIMPPCNPCA
jgi:hypothetical protein